MKDNGKRIKFWGYICLISFLLFIAGKVSFNNGYGEYGRALVTLKPIASAFNNLENVVNFKDLEAKVSKKSIIVTYINGNNKKEKYIYELKSADEFEYIESTIDTSNAISRFIAQQMVDAVYRKDGFDSSIYNTFDFSSFSNSTVKDGVSTKNNIIAINITDDIASGLFQVINTKLGYKYFVEDDITAIVKELKEKKKATKELDSMKIYVIEEDTNYKAYISYNDSISAGSLMSLSNLMKVLNKKAYDTLEFEKQVPKFENETEYYSIDYSSRLTTEAFFNEEENVCLLIIKK